MIVKYLAVGNANDLSEESLSEVVATCGELGMGLQDTKEAAQAEAATLVNGVVFEVSLAFKKV